MRLFAVIGRPVLHSRSPEMFASAFAAARVDAAYFRFAAENCAEAIRVSREIGLDGLNVTSPFKEEMPQFCERLEGDAGTLGAVNTIKFEGTAVIGYNTDVHGVRSALESKCDLQGKKSVVFGAGGAAKAAVLALIGAGSEVIVANRTIEKAEAIAEKFGCGFCELSGASLAGAMHDSDVVVSTISSAERLFPKKLFRKNQVVLDANYAARTAFSADAKSAGSKIVDPREWLVNQGAKSFEIFTGLKAPVKAMESAVFSRKASGKKANLSLIGFMGSGKTEAGKAISSISGRKLVETDLAVEASSKMKIPEIFASKGESHFRGLESKEVKKAARQRNAIISCGGGVVLSPSNVSALKKASVVCWLWAGIDETLERLANDTGRPLLGSENRRPRVEQLLSGRLGLYARHCDLMVATGGKSPAKVAERVLLEAH